MKFSTLLFMTPGLQIKSLVAYDPAISIFLNFVRKLKRGLQT